MVQPFLIPGGYRMTISDSTLEEIRRKGIRTPSYDRKNLRTVVAHIGLGHFHRSHFLTYMDELLEKGLSDGGVFELDVIPVSEKFIYDFREQDYLYSVLSLSPDGTEDLRINGPVTGYANQAWDPDKVAGVLSDESVRLITLTITEKGYTYRDDEKSLNWSDDGIQHDLTTDEPARTAVGCLSYALSLRAEKNLPVTVMSCDNVPENGKMLRTCIFEFCGKKYPDIIPWLERNVSFPCTMVDRITPGTGEDDREKLRHDYDIDDRCPVHAESFMQWVIEDDFITAVPDFRASGALVVDDVMPYELMKIRLLNGSHSALSYPAYMMGYTMVDKAVSDPLIRKFIREYYMEEITETLSPVPGIDLDDYKDQLIKRFSNPYIADKVLRLASDGSKKISNAIFRPLEEAFAKGIPMDSVILALAMWEYYYQVVDSEGHHMPVDDPKGEELAAVSEDPQGFFRIAGLSESVLTSSLFTGKVREYLSSLRNDGVRETLENYMS